ncbi:MAG: SRPBCC family protein [Brevundimonas sp.]
MDFRVENKIGVPATADALWEVLSDLERWSHWNPVFVEAQGALGINAPLSLVERIEGLGERQVQARLGDWTPYAKLVWGEKRGWQFTSTRYVLIDEITRGSCIVTNGEIYGGMRGESWFMKHRRTLRLACETMNEALRDQALAHES